jgi:hypothetical protein
MSALQNTDLSKCKCHPCTNIHLCTRVQDLRPAPTLNCLSECWCQPSTTTNLCVKSTNCQPCTITNPCQNAGYQPCTNTNLCVRVHDISDAQTLICVSMNPCINQMNIISIQHMQSSVFKQGIPVVFEHATEATKDSNFKNNTAKPSCRFTEYEERGPTEI